MTLEKDSKDKSNIDAALAKAKEIISQIKYGSVSLVVQDGIVVQIESNEKFRLK
ncbi:MAG: YezD family protein [Treponema sp.]|nr:YezD family protein [Treponema sp.]